MGGFITLQQKPIVFTIVFRVREMDGGCDQQWVSGSVSVLVSVSVPESV